MKMGLDETPQIEAATLITKQIKTRPGKSSKNIYDRLRIEIMQNQLPANQSLKQDKIAKQFGVSKIPVREALRLLEADGLIEFKPRRGAFVVELDENEILENLDIRIALECRAIELAIPNMTERDITQAHEILTDYKDANDKEKWSDLNGLFHQCLYSPCRRPKLLQMIQSTRDRTSLFMRLKITQMSGLARPHAEHIAILKACKANKANLGAKLVRQHIDATRKEVLAYFRNNI